MTKSRYMTGQLNRDEPEWDAAWAVIAKRHGSTTCRDEITGEVWQYMGSTNASGRWEHGFRHRCIGYETVAATDGWKPSENSVYETDDDLEIPF